MQEQLASMAINIHLKPQMVNRDSLAEEERALTKLDATEMLKSLRFGAHKVHIHTCLASYLILLTETKRAQSQGTT
jgi:hypothetical protein